MGIKKDICGRNKLNQQKVQEDKTDHLKITVHPEAERRQPGLNMKLKPAHVPKPDGGGGASVGSLTAPKKQEVSRPDSNSGFPS